MPDHDLDVAIVGAGPAGLGVACALRSLGLERIAVLDRHEVGASFARWPAEMRLITPSFTSNAWGPVDLNAITPTTSPAYTLATEHPTGEQYATYLRIIAEHFEVPVRTGLDVRAVLPREEGFEILTDDGPLRARTVVWAVGEFATPRRTPFPTAELAVHTADLASYGKLDGSTHVVIGGYESGVDAAVHLAAAGRRVVVLDRTGRWEDHGSDPSLTLSPFTRDRLEAALDTGLVEVVGGVDVIGIEREGDGYAVLAAEGERWTCDGQPVLATGFGSGLGVVADLFDRDAQGAVVLDDGDGSTLVPGLHLAGPEVAHEGLVFCFIYKFRQRFAVVASAVGERLGVDTSPLEAYRDAGMFLDDLSCCHASCAC
jgi:putative flavoprotein involved in K+ transport